MYQQSDYEGAYNLKAMEKQLIIRALSIKRTKIAAAEALGLSQRNLYLKIYKHRIK